MTDTAFSLTRRSVLAASFGFALAAMVPAMALAADDPNISDKTALERQDAGDLILVDVRTPPEWRHTGVAKGALTIDMQDPQFVQKIVDLRKAHPDAEIGFICASSNRSSQVQAYLAQHGFANTFSVYGGMTGNGKVPGWIADGLPVEAWSGN